MKQVLRGLARRGLGVLDWRTRQRVMNVAALFRHEKTAGYAPYSVASVDASPKHADPTKLIDRLHRYEQALGEEIEFAGKTVLEIGAGPVLGWALVGLARGATKYNVVEPAFNPEVVDAYSTYFRRHRQWIRRIVGDVAPVAELLDSGLIHVVPDSASRTRLPDGSIDLVLSNSVLEHVDDVDALMEELDRVCTRDALQYHVVDFGDHQGGADPFEHLYSQDPDTMRALYRNRRMPINLLRAEQLAERLGLRFNVATTVFLEDPSYPSVRAPDSYWAEHFTRDQLGVEVAAFKLSRRPPT